MNSKNILDALVGASGAGNAANESSSTHRRFLQDALRAFGGGSSAGSDTLLGDVFGQATGGLRDIARDLHRSTGSLGSEVDAAGEAALGDPTVQDLASRVREAIGQNPGLTQGALLGVAGLLLGTNRGRGLARNLVGLGGLALVSGLAYRAFQNYQAGRPALDVSAGTSVEPSIAPAELHPASATEQDALLFVRAMISAAQADGHMDQQERERVVTGLKQAGIDGDSARWLEQELGKPSTIEELAREVSSPAKAAQVYAAARLAIDPDTMQERDFLHRLAEALKLAQPLKAEIDEGESGLKTTVTATAA